MPRDEPIELPGHETQLTALVESYATVARSGRGTIAFVAGDAASGRSELLQALSSRLQRASPGPIVLKGTMHDGAYVSDSTDSRVPELTRRIRTILTVAGPSALLADAILHLGGFLGAGTAMGQQVADLVERTLQNAGTAEPEILLPQVLRDLCAARGSVVCVVDDVEQASVDWWSDLLLFFGRRITADLPLMLVMGVERVGDGPGSHDPQESNAMFVARQLVSEGLASWHNTRKVTIDELRAWTGPASTDLLRSALEVTDSNALHCSLLWQNWARRGAIEAVGPERRWEFARGRDLFLDEVDDLLSDRLHHLVEKGDLRTLEAIRAVLSCGALEGRTFTADAVAQALGRDRDAVNDLLDEFLTSDEETTNGLLEDAGGVTVRDEAGERHLWRYRFASKLVWLTFQHHGLAANAEQDLSRRLAFALAASYGREGWRVADAVVRLAQTGAVEALLIQFRELGERHAGSTVALWRAEMVLREGASGNRSERRRATRTLLAATDFLGGGPFAKGLALAEAAYTLADETGDQIEALRSCGVFHECLGQVDLAIATLMQAEAMAHDQGSRFAEAKVRYALARAYYRRGCYDIALSGAQAALDVFIQDKHLRSQAGARWLLGDIAAKVGNFEAAQIEWDEALKLTRLMRDWTGVAYVLRELAALARRNGDNEQARTFLLESVGLFRQTAHLDGEARTLVLLARVSYQLHDIDGARRMLATARVIYDEIGEKEDAALVEREIGELGL